MKMLAGQTIDDYAAVADRLAQTFGAADCRVRSIPGRRHLLQLWLLICDPLEDLVAAVRRRTRTASPPASRSRWWRTARCGGCRCSATTS